MKKLTILIGLFSSLIAVNNLPVFGQEGAKPAADAPAAKQKTGTLLDAKSMSEAAKSALADMKTYKDEKSGYTIDYPSSWELRDSEPPYSFKFFAFNGQVNAYGAMDEVPADVTARMFAAVVKEHMSSQPGYAYKMISEKPVKIAGVDGIQRVQQITHEGSTGNQIAVFFVTNSKAYQFNGTAIAEEYSVFEPVFQKMIDSIKLEKGTKTSN